MKQNLRFGLVLGQPAILIISAILLEYSTFDKEVHELAFFGHCGLPQNSVTQKEP